MVLTEIVDEKISEKLEEVLERAYLDIISEYKLSKSKCQYSKKINEEIISFSPVGNEWKLVTLAYTPINKEKESCTSKRKSKYVHFIYQAKTKNVEIRFNLDNNLQNQKSYNFPRYENKQLYQICNDIRNSKEKLSASPLLIATTTCKPEELYDTLKAIIEHNNTPIYY